MQDTYHLLRIIFVMASIVGGSALAQQADMSLAQVNIPVTKLNKAPVIDGNDNDWPSPGASEWHSLSTSASYIAQPGDAEESASWKPNLRVRVGVFGDRFYMLASWEDQKADTVYRPWKKRGKKYLRSRRRDDMFAIRFHLSGNYQICMLNPADYSVDMWIWSAGRSDLVGLADDLRHDFSTKFVDAAAEYPMGDDTFYIKRISDDGEPGWGSARPGKNAGRVVKSIVLKNKPSGSRADVLAKGRWQDGVWHLELSRKLKTDDPTDVEFKPGTRALAQLAVFHPGYRMRKQISQAVSLDFGEIK